MDWANAFSSKATPLAIRFNEDFKRAFHFSSPKDRGYTQIKKIKVNTNKAEWYRPLKNADILVVKLNSSLPPNKKVQLNLEYIIKIPSDRYTQYGFSKNKYKIRYWNLSPAIYNNGWVTYSHKKLNDYASQLSDYELMLDLPKKYRLESNLTIKSLTEKGTHNRLTLNGKFSSNIQLYIEEENYFYQTKYDNHTISSNIPKEGMNSDEVTEAITRVHNFVKQYFGELPQGKILLSYEDYLKQPVYGFNQLPKVLRPFKSKFQYEIITLKQLTNEVKKHSFISNLRTDQWFTDGIQIYLMMKYVEKYYPKATFAGRLSTIFGLRWFHAAKLKFNDQYYIGYKNMAARFLEQPLGKPKDSLLKFNYNISNPYKSGMGLHYLESYLDEGELDNKIRTFIKEYKLQVTSANNFKNYLSLNVSKNINWYTNQFIEQDTITDVKVAGVYRSKDSIYIKLKNKGKPVPVKLTALKRKKIIKQKWSPVFKDTATISFPKKVANHFVVDYEGRLPEFSRRNNYQKTTGIFRKPFQFRLFQDIEDPKYTQIYTVPVYDFNVYDGLILGARFLNKSLVPRRLNYNIVPSYGLRSNKFQGSIGVGYTQQLKNYGWSFLNYSISASTSSFAEGRTFTRITPSVRFSYRPKDYRANISQSITARIVSIQRENNPNTTDNPNYSVFNARYRYSNNNLTHVKGFNIDYQLADNFSRASATFNYRKLFKNNRQINFRTYLGGFLYNNTEENGNFFSFALDRPSDYLFDLGYFARDDNSGIASQQFITTEGNFKSRFRNRFANQWIGSATLETNIWNWIFVYANGAVLKNRESNSRAVFDTGIRLNLLQDYFELYFPLQSSLGFEPSFDNYGQRIRFKASLSIETLIGLFTREWY